MKPYVARLALDALFGLIIEVLCDLHTLGLVGSNPWLTPSVAILATILGGLSLTWFVEEKRKWHRFGFVLAGALGYAVGDLAVIWLAGGF